MRIPFQLGTKKGIKHTILPGIAVIQPLLYLQIAIYIFPSDSVDASFGSDLYNIGNHSSSLQIVCSLGADAADLTQLFLGYIFFVAKG